MSHVITAWNIPLCQIQNGISVKNIQVTDLRTIECEHCRNRYFAILNKQDFFVSRDSSLFLFPLVRSSGPEEGEQPTNFVIVDDHDENLLLPANEYMFFLQRYLDWRVNK